MPVELEIPDLPKGVKSVNIKEQKLFDGLSFPLILSPAGDFKDKDGQFWNDWVKEHLKVIEKLLQKYGAVLFRGFPFDTPNEFDVFSKAYGYKEFPYDGGIAVRSHVVGNVYTANESPPEALIPLHHEMAYLDDYPHIIFLYCDIPAKANGNTPVVLSNHIYRKMTEREPDFVKRLEKEGVRYIRIAPDGDSMTAADGRGWQSTFQVSSREVAEQKAKDFGYDFEWLPDGSMKTITNFIPGIRVHKRSGRKMWFNAIFSSYTLWQEGRSDGRKAVVFPNGGTVSDATIGVLRQIIDEVNVSFSWQHKDVLMMDNRNVLHTREDFVPPRRMLVSLFQDCNGPLVNLVE